jgi:histidine triad (HIT) family protein
MNDCIFCKIIAGELPSYKIYEDDLFFGFLDIRPLSRGNSLLIPKVHHRWVLDVPQVSQYWQTASKIAIATIKAVNADYVSFLTLGMEVPHAHIRIIPRFYDDTHKDGISTKNTIALDPSEMAKIRDEIVSNL